VVTKKEISVREKSILGKPPRIEAELSDEVIAMARMHIAKLRTTGGETISQEALEAIDVSMIPEMVLSLLSCHPELYECLAAVSVMLMAKTELSRRDLELVVLRTDWLCQSPYNWGEHVSIAKRYGVTDEEIERVTQGPSAPEWTDHDRALMSAADELHNDNMLSDETWDALAASFSEKQMFELIVLVGQFTLVTNFQNTLRFRLGEGNRGLQSR